MKHMCESSGDYVNVRFWIGKGESKDLRKNNEHDPSRPGLTLAAIHLSTLKHPQAATSFDKSKWSIQTIAAQRKYRKKVFTSALKAFSVFF